MSRAEQIAVAVMLASRPRDTWLARFPTVLGVGVGRKVIRPSAMPTDRICLSFFVPSKDTHSLPSRQLIPRYLRARVVMGGRHLRLSIPTDVHVMSSDGRPHAPTVDLTHGILVSNRTGNAAAIVVADDSRKYLLTCFHLASATMQFAGSPAPIRDGADPNPEIGGFKFPTSDQGTAQSATFPVDAILGLLLDQDLTFLTAWGTQIRVRVTEEELWRQVDSPLLLLARELVYGPDGQAIRRTRPLVAHFVSYCPQALTFNYPPEAQGAPFEFPGTITYNFEEGNTSLPGDSGSPLIDPAGKLVGMHFYGAGVTGYSFSAPYLFKTGVLPFPVRLP